MLIGILTAILLVAIILAIYLIVSLSRDKQNIGEQEKQEGTLLEILVPRNNEKGPLQAENMFAALHGILDQSKSEQDHISFEINSKDKYILFYCWAPNHLKDFVEGQIYAQYPTVEIKEASEDISLNVPSDMIAIGTMLELNKNEVFPIKTFLNFEVDPLSSITGVLSKVNGRQQIWIQVMIKPVSDEWQQKGIKYVNAIRNGESTEKLSLSQKVISGAYDLTKEVIKSATTITPSETKNDGAGEIRLSGPEEAGLAGIEQKVTKLGYETKIRIVAVAEDEQTARTKLQGVVSAFKQFNATNINGFSIKEVLMQDDIVYKYRNRAFSKPGYILNIEEIASIFHLPHVSVETPSIAWAGSKKGEPPSNLPVEGSVDEVDLTMFGQTNFRNYQQKFGIKTSDRRLHFYAIGKTGTGKSTMLENMIIDDILEGRGVAVVDPHGDLIEHVLDFIPEKRIQDVVYFAPADREFPIGFNILETVDEDLRGIVASGVVGIFKKIFGESWGPRLEYILRNAVLSLLDYPEATMLGITKVLVDKVYRKKVVDNVKDPVIKDFWVNEFEQYDNKFRTEAVAPIQNKVGQFLSSSTIRNIVGQPKSTIDLSEIMDNKRILLVDLAVGKVGEDVSALLGAMMITKIQLSAMQRANIPEEQRQDFYLYVDEFQNFATDSFATILSEARKYRLNIILGHQYIGQLITDVSTRVRDAVFGNVGTKIVFRVGATDAEFLETEFEPEFIIEDLVNLPNYSIYLKLMVDGVTSRPFSAVTLPPFKIAASTSIANNIIQMSRKNYSRPNYQVEKEINLWSGVMKERETFQRREPRPEKGGREDFSALTNLGIEFSSPANKAGRSISERQSRELPPSPPRESIDVDFLKKSIDESLRKKNL